MCYTVTGSSLELYNAKTSVSKILGSKNFTRWLVWVVVRSRGGGIHYFSDVKSQTAGLWRKFIKKELDIMRFRHNEVNFEVTRSHLMIIEMPEKFHKRCFCLVWMTLRCEVKIDLIKSEPHYVKFFFMNLLHSSTVYLFDI